MKYDKELQNKIYNWIRNENMTYRAVAERLGAKNVNSCIRRLANIVKHFDEQKTKFSDISLDSMTRDERYEYLKKNIENFPRVKMFFASFSGEERAVFLDEYLKIVRSFDSLTEPEEQTLFTAILEYILAARALRLKSIEEKLYEKSMSGEIKEDDAEFRRTVSDRYQKEYESHMKNYENLLKACKATRNQRLSEIKSERKTLVDVAQEMTNKSIQSDMAERIIKLSDAKDEELKRLIEGGYLFGDFKD